MTAAVYDITIEQGATFRRLLTLKDNQVPPVAIDITGFTFRGEIKKSARTQALAAFVFTDDVGDELVPVADPADGEIYMTLSPAASAEIPVHGTSYKTPSVFYYDVEMVDTNGTVFRILNGTANVSPEITT